MNNRVRWRISALASAIALLGSLASIDAHALALGRISVQSALGEPLRAEIEIVDINAAEAASLTVGVASEQAFKSAGMEYTSAVAGAQVVLLKRPDGRSFLRLSSSRPVTEPFVDLVLNATWSSGRVVRDYTMLFDPPNMRQSGVTAAQVAPVPPRQALPAAAPVQSAKPDSAVASDALPQGNNTPATSTSTSSSDRKQLNVKSGDTAGKIAAQNKPASVSLDQMLVALLRSNPDAFIGGNVNRLKAGALLDIPAPEQADSVPPAEASRMIVAQSRNFNEFRRKLAESVPPAKVDSASRQASGKVEAKVEDRAPATTTPDKLTLSKGAVQGKESTEDKIAKRRQSKEASSRVAELEKNIGELSKIAGPATAASAAKVPVPTLVNPGLPTRAQTAPLSPPTPVAAPTPVAPPAPPVPPVRLPPAPVPAVTPAPVPAKAAAVNVPAVSLAAPAVAASEAPVGSTEPKTQTSSAETSGPGPGSMVSVAPVLAASAPALQASQALPASSQAVALAEKKSAPAPASKPADRGFIDELSDNPFVLPGAAVLLLLLGGLALLRFRKRNASAQVDSSFLESRLQPDSFFGASGGQRIDTNEGGAFGSSLVYSPSQLDAAGDVDPVAEADVYLAYGRDLQAEEILKEAIRVNPKRVAVLSKLMEIYAKRRDMKAFEVVATDAFSLTGGEGTDWEYIAQLGRELDPSNPIYQPGGRPASARAGKAAAAQSTASGFGTHTLPQAMEPSSEPISEPISGLVDLDLDLDFAADQPAAIVPPVAKAPLLPTASPVVSPPAAAKSSAPVFDGLELDLPSASPSNAMAKTSISSPKDLDFNDLDLSGALDFTAEKPVAAKKPVAVAPAPAAVHDDGMMEFDLGSLSLDLGGPTTESPALASTAAAPAALSDDPLETKFALAEEFRALGDTDGARSLAEEVVSDASGSLKTKAQAFLNALS